ncbi:MAG TPA: type III-A CRISPR-associated RAMP protein Csm3 [Ignavibacteriaceae bacterium]|nr:type III-A CRISPR-associated RAMP protein Csm3 [Ignavibacteriaceae bacterium]
MNNNNSFLGNIILRGKLKTLTPLHIGGSKDKFEIGGVDNPVIKDPVTNYPYIPGSSLKGKLRMLLEFAEGVVNESNKKKGEYPPSSDSIITSLFGDSADNSSNGPTRLIVRDAYPDKETTLKWEKINSETLYTEYKAENTIDRMTSAANPRFMERVHKDSKFDVEFVLQVFSMDSDNGKSNFEKLIKSIRLLEDSTLGGGGSRGSGKVGFCFYEPYFVSVNDYQNGNGNFKKIFGENVSPEISTKEIKFESLKK